MNLSTVLKEQRKKLGFTLARIAEEMGVSEATVQRWESGNIKHIQQERIEDLAEILHVTPSYLMGWESNKNNVATKLRKARLQANMTQKEVADLIGMTYQAISNYERGKTKVESDILVKLCEIYGISVSEILIPKQGKESALPPGFEPMPKMVKIPLITDGNITDHVSVVENWRADFALRCHGNSMEPKIQDGDIVAIRKLLTVESGQIAAVRIEGKVILTKVYVYEDRMMLQPINTSYDPTMLLREEMDTVIIEGKAVGLCRVL